MMRFYLATALLAGLWLANSSPAMQQSDAQQRAEQMAVAFNKTKHKVKEKQGIRIEVFVEIMNEPAPRTDARQYAGTYAADDSYTLTVQVGTDGRVTASGSEPGQHEIRRFILRDARIEGALLTGTKLYEGGGQEKFEGVFLNRTVRASQTSPGRTTFGLGVLYDPPKFTDYGTLSRIFYEMKP